MQDMIKKWEHEGKSAEKTDFEKLKWKNLSEIYFL